MKILKAAAAAMLIYIILDAAADFLLEPLGLGYLHAFIAMFGGMFVGGWLACRGFIPVALGLGLFFSMLSYVLVAQMRDQSVLALIAEQHPMVSIGSLVGALLGAWAGQSTRWAPPAGARRDSG